MATYTMGAGKTPPEPKRQDAELLALSRLTRILAGLDEPTRARVVAYLASRYLPDPPAEDYPREEHRDAH